jgi:mannosyltransferase
MKRTHWLLIGILLTAFFLRMFNLNTRAMWYDEAFTVLYSQLSFAQMWYGTMTQVNGVASDVHPLFYYTLIHDWLPLVGDSPLAVRFFSVMFGVASAAVVYRLTRELWDNDRRPMTANCIKSRSKTQLPLVAALVVAVAPFHIAYSQEARMYAQLGFFALLLMLGYVMVEKGRGRGWRGILVLGGVGMLYSHNLGVFFGIALGLWILIQKIRVRDWRGLARYAVAGVVIILLWLPWLSLVPSQLGKIQQAYWIGAPTLLSLLQTILTFTVDFDFAQLPTLLLPFGLVGALLLVLLLAFEFVRGGWRDACVRFIALLAVLPPLLIVLVSLWSPVYLTRALMPSFLMGAILVAWLFVRLPRVLSIGLGIGLAALTLGSFAFYYKYADFPRPPFREAVAWLEANASAHDAIVHDNKLTFFPMYYYARDGMLSQSFIADPAGAGSDTLAYPTQQALSLYAESPGQAALDQSRVWFVIFREAREESAQAGNLDWMRAHYHQVQETSLHDLELYLFEK